MAFAIMAPNPRSVKPKHPKAPLHTNGKVFHAFHLGYRVSAVELEQFGWEEHGVSRCRESGETQSRVQFLIGGHLLNSIHKKVNSQVNF